LRAIVIFSPFGRRNTGGSLRAKPLFFRMRDNSYGFLFAAGVRVDTICRNPNKPARTCRR
jgi:hypothetical protein